VIRSITFDEARQITQQAMDLSTGKDVVEFSRRQLKELLKK